MAINVPLNAQLQNATQLQQQIQNAVNSVRINLGGQNGARTLSSLSQPLGRLTGQADEFTKSLDAANARVLAFGASVGVVNAVTNAFKSLVNSTIEVEKAITAISVVGDQFAGKTKELSQGLFNIAKATGQSFSEVSKAALEFSRQGLQLEDTLSRTQDALVLTRLTGLDAAKSVDGLTAAVNAFSKAGLSTTQIINKLAAVDQAFAVSSADLIEGFNRSAAVAQNAGVTFDELAGIITALQQETSRGGAVIGNALKTIFTRLQDTSTLNQLQNLGVAVQDLQGNILPARQILQNLAKDVEGLGQITKAGIFKDVAGTFQINQLISLVGDLNKENSVAAAATLKSAGATNQAYIANEKLNQSLDAVLNKVATTGKQLGSLLGELGLTDNLKGLLDGINSFLEGANNLLQGDDIGSNFAKGFVKGIGAVLSGPGLGIFLAIIGKLSLDLAKFGAQSLKAFFGIGKAAADQKQVQESIVQTLLKNQSVLNSILNTQGGQNAQALKFLGLLNQQAAAMQAIQGLAGGIASTVYAGGYRATPGGLQRKAAGGYLPAQEASDVRRGVGGASPSSKVVAIPNFAFGGGKRGTMIANTSEYIVPNYAGGGSAIFNQDMVKTMGLPAGAKKISAAGGFIPNFAGNYIYDSDRFLGENKKLILENVLASNKKKDVLVAPSGAGKSTYAKSLGTFISSLEDVGRASSFTILSAAGLSKTETGLSKNFESILNASLRSGGKITYLGVSNEEIENRRKVRQIQGLTGGDVRSAAQLSGSLKIEKNNFKFIRALQKSVQLADPATSKKRFEILRSKEKVLASEDLGVEKTGDKYAMLVNDLGGARKNQLISYKPRDGERVSYLADIYGVQDIESLKNASKLQKFNQKYSSQSLEKKYTDLALQDASDYSNDLIGKPLSPIAATQLSNKGSVPSLVGSIFESAISAALQDEELLKAQSERNSNALFDFKEVANSKFNKFFGIPNSVNFVEAKYADNDSTRESFASKIYKNKSQKNIEKSTKMAGFSSRPFIIRPKDFKEKIKQISGKNFRAEGLTPEQIEQLIAAGGFQTNSSSGYVPNFAAAALQQAIAREKSAGLSDSQIYVDQSAALKSPMNPMGLMVANRRDEPAGGFQGISRARKEGMNPKLYGAAGGFVPNYAVQAPIGQIAAIKGVLAQDKVDAFNKALEDTAKQLKSNQISLSQAEQNIEIYAQTVGTSAKGQKILESEGKKLIQAYDTESKARKQKAEELRKQRSDKKNISEPPKDVNKGFADAAGKIFLLQSALSFLQGAVGDTEDSFAKITNAFASASGNITSLALLGKEIQGIKIDGTGLAAGFGKFAKGLGIAGVAFGVVTEGFKFANFALKEFSGENKRAADALAGLETAAQGALVSLNDLTPAGQRTAQETGKAALESFSGSFLSNLFSEAAGKNPEIQKQVALLAAQGIGQKQIQTLLEKETLQTTAQRLAQTPGRIYSGKSTEEVIKATKLDQVLSDYAEVGDLGAAISNLFQNSEVTDLGKALATVREKFKTGEFNQQTTEKQIYTAVLGAEKLDPKILQSVKDAGALAVNTNKVIIAQQREQALGERINIELAKQKLDNLIEQKKTAIDLNASAATEGIRLQLETLDLSESYKNNLENQLKLKEIDAELSKKNLDLVSASIDKLSSLPSESVLGVSASQFNEMAKALEGLDIKTAQDLEGAITNIGDKLGLTPQQLEKINALFKEQFQQAQKNADAQKQAAKNAADFNAKVIDTKNSLQAARLLTEQIANDLERAAGVRLSFAEVGISATENRAKLLRARAGAATTNVEKRGLESEAIRADQLANEQRRISSEEQYKSTLQIKQGESFSATVALNRAREQLRKGQIDSEQFKQVESAAKTASDAIIKLNNSQEIARQNFALTSQELQMQAESIYRVVGANDALKNSLDQFKLGAGERIGAAMFEQLGATDINSLMQARIKQNVETDALGIENDQDRYKFVQEQTRLRQIQFDLATAESAVRRRELEYELKYTQEIIDLKNQGASDQELIDARNRQILEQRSGRRGFEKGLDTIQERIDNYRSTLGEEIPNLFSSNLAQGLNDAISGAKSLKEALSDAATSFFQEITRRNISNLADLVTGGLGKGVSGGGGIFSSILSFFGGNNKASGGLIKGGSGTKDDVPAMLMGGEYVVKKSAVNKYGKGFLDALNNGKMRGYATGGLVDPQTFPTQTGRGGFFTPGDYGQGAITGKNELLTFATQSFTGGQYDYMGGFGMGGATIGLESESARLSSFGRENSPMFERVQQSKDEAFKVYLEGLQKEKEYAELLDQIAKNEKARKKQLQTAIISAVVSSVASYAGEAGKTGAKNATAAASKAAEASGKTLSAGAKFMAGAKGIFTGAGGQGGIFNIPKGTGTQLSDLAIAAQNAVKGAAIGNQSVQGAVNAKAKSYKMSAQNAVIEKQLTSMMGKVGTGTKGIAMSTAYGNANIDPTTAQDIQSGKIKEAWQYLGNKGNKLTAGQSIASNVLRGGTILKIAGKQYIVEDIGGMGPNVLDFYSGSNKNLYNQFTNQGNVGFEIINGGLKSKQALLKAFKGDYNKFQLFQKMFGLRASGGLITGGSNIRDDVPTMLTGGEFVLNNRATQRIGLQNLNKLNNGQSVGGEGASAEMTQALISKLDELIQATQNSSSENVVVNVSSNEAGGQNQENPAGAEKELHKKIRQAVLDVIAQEKRLGGSLEKSR